MFVIEQLVYQKGNSPVLNLYPLGHIYLIAITSNQNQPPSTILGGWSGQGKSKLIYKYRFSQSFEMSRLLLPMHSSISVMLHDLSPWHIEVISDRPVDGNPHPSWGHLKHGLSH